ncbi:MAG: alpha/beta hydrolase family protein, partial [Phycisphaerales bacterium]
KALRFQPVSGQWSAMGFPVKTDYRRWRQKEYRYTPQQFLALDRLPSGLFMIDYGAVELALLIRNRGASASFYGFHAAQSPLTRQPVPYFQGRKVAPKRMNQILVSDPSLYLHDDVRVGWFLGNRHCDLVAELPPIMDKIDALAGAERRLLWGNSAGGTAALRYAREQDVSVVMNPQIVLRNFTWGRVEPWLLHGWGIDDYWEGREFGEKHGDLRDAPPTTLGEPLFQLRSLAVSPGFRPSLEFTRTGPRRDIDAVIVRPRDFDANKQYPVIVNVYGGPTSVMVERVRDRYLFQQWIADHGFIVVAMDGRGTPRRDAAWQRAVHKDFITKPLEDQVRGLQSLGERYREMDLSRVGIYGWSYGGYFSAMAVMQRPDVFQVGVAGAPVTDWIDYDTHYTERYAGHPETDAESYAVSNVLTYADKLERPLLIIHGTADDNVYFVHALKMADALFKAGKDFDFLPLSNQTHRVSDPDFVVPMWTRVVNYFEGHLGDPSSN